MSRKVQEQAELVKAITQAVISVVIVIGGMVLLYLRPGDVAVSGLIGTIVAYYFLEANRAKTIKRTVAEIEAQKAK